MGKMSKTNNVIKGKHITIHGKIKQEKEYIYGIFQNVCDIIKLELEIL